MGAPLEQLTGAHGLVARRYEPLADGLLERRPDQTRLLQSLQKTQTSPRGGLSLASASGAVT